MVQSRKNKTRSQPVYCTGANVKKDSIVLGAQRSWLYVGRIAGKDVMPENIRQYLQDVNGYKKS